ncbi:MAG TPA: hypothetical protein VLS51_04550 [Propionibacteriaceae bacterium]|nr:hypothetical protein [Propionibacteriaceae bacterium]
MTIPVLPRVDDILVNSATALRTAVLPTVTDEFAQLTVALVATALEYAVELLAEPRDVAHRAELDAALHRVGDVPEVDADASPFERASQALVWAQRNPGPRADEVRSILHEVLIDQLERETVASAPLLATLHAAMHKAH